MGILKKLRKDFGKNTSNVPVDHLKLPVGNVVSDPVKGDFLAFPLFGWVATRARTQTPLVMLLTTLIRSTEDLEPRGSLQIEFPIFEDTELATLGVLEGYGWDGRVWPQDAGWPDDNPEDHQHLRSLLEKVGLGATFVFPPAEQGTLAQPIIVTRAKGPFLMPPLPIPKSFSQEKMKRLREVCANSTVFMQRPQGS